MCAFSRGIACDPERFDRFLIPLLCFRDFVRSFIPTERTTNEVDNDRTVLSVVFGVLRLTLTLTSTLEHAQVLGDFNLRFWKTQN